MIQSTIETCALDRTYVYAFTKVVHVKAILVSRQQYFRECVNRVGGNYTTVSLNSQFSLRLLTYYDTAKVTTKQVHLRFKKMGLQVSIQDLNKVSTD